MTLNAELTKRENEVAELLAWGAAKKEVADRLFISTRTVENTARNIYAKTGVQKATELCVWWFCKKCGVPPSLDPLKRAFYALVLLAIFIPRELTANGPVQSRTQDGKDGENLQGFKTKKRRFGYYRLH